MLYSYKGHNSDSSSDRYSLSQAQSVSSSKRSIGGDGEQSIRNYSYDYIIDNNNNSNSNIDRSNTASPKGYINTSNDDSDLNHPSPTFQHLRHNYDPSHPHHQYTRHLTPQRPVVSSRDATQQNTIINSTRQAALHHAPPQSHYTHQLQQQQHHSHAEGEWQTTPTSDHNPSGNNKDSNSKMRGINNRLFDQRSTIKKVPKQREKRVPSTEMRPSALYSNNTTTGGHDERDTDGNSVRNREKTANITTNNNDNNNQVYTSTHNTTTAKKEQEIVYIYETRIQTLLNEIDLIKSDSQAIHQKDAAIIYNMNNKLLKLMESYERVISSQQQQQQVSATAVNTTSTNNSNSNTAKAVQVVGEGPQSVASHRQHHTPSRTPSYAPSRTTNTFKNQQYAGTGIQSTASSISTVSSKPGLGLGLALGQLSPAIQHLHGVLVDIKASHTQDKIYIQSALNALNNDLTHLTSFLPDAIRKLYASNTHTSNINSPSLLPSNAVGDEVESEEVKGDKMVLSCLYQALTDLNLLPPELSTQLETILNRGRYRGGASDEGEEEDIYENKIQMIANMKDSLIHQLTTTENSNTLQSPILQKSPRPNTNLKYTPTTQTPRNQQHLSQYDTEQHQQLLLLYEQQQQLNLTLQIENKDNLYNYNTSLQLLQAENEDLKQLIKHIINNEMSTSYILEDYREKFALSLSSPIPIHSNTTNNTTFPYTPTAASATDNSAGGGGTGGGDSTGIGVRGEGSGGAGTGNGVSNLHRMFFSDIQEEEDGGIQEGSELLISQPIHTGTATAADQTPVTPYTPTHHARRKAEESYYITANDDNLYVTSVQSPKGDDIVANIQQRNERLMHTVNDKLLEIGQKYRV